MNINSISGSLAAVKMPNMSTVSADQPLKGTSVASQPVQPSTDAVNAAAADKISVTDKQSPHKPASGVENASSPGVISHVVVSYNQQGKVRTKFEDSRNNVVYQVPSELVSKLEDQMLKPETSTSVKG